MLIFLDETFRELDRGGEKHKFGAMCGVAIPIGDYTKIANTIYKLKLQHLGKDYADNSELKGKNLLSRTSFKQHEMYPEGSTNVKLIESILQFLKKSKIRYLGVSVLTKPCKVFLARTLVFLMLHSKVSVNVSTSI